MLYFPAADACDVSLCGIPGAEGWRLVVTRPLSASNEFFDYWAAQVVYVRCPFLISNIYSSAARDSQGGGSERRPKGGGVSCHPSIYSFENNYETREASAMLTKEEKDEGKKVWSP